MWGLPESPRWLVKKGRDKEAIEVLCAVFDLNEDDEYVRGEIEAIHAAIAVEAGQGSGKISSLFKKDILQTRWRIFLAWFGLFMNQWSGINLVRLHLVTGCSNFAKARLDSAILITDDFSVGRVLHAYCFGGECRAAAKGSAPDCWMRRTHVPNRKYTTSPVLG